MDEFAAIDRRALMRNLGLLLGAAALPPLSACSAAMEGQGALDDAQMKLLTAIADTIIPVTDTPGAVAAKVPQLISGLMRDWASRKTRAEITGAIDAIGRLAKDANFADLSPQQRAALLAPHDKAAVAPGPPPRKKASAIAKLLGGPPKSAPGYVRLKGLIINLYYNSEIAMTQEVVYEHVPGKFVPSIDITPDTRPFAGVGGIF